MRTNYEPRTTNHVIKTPESRDANLSFVRPKHNLLTYNPIAMSLLRLGDYKHQISSFLRPCPSLRRLPHTTHPTTCTPKGDAHLSFVRHHRPSLTNNPLTMRHLHLGDYKRRISGLVRHPSVGNPHNHLIVLTVAKIADF